MLHSDIFYAVDVFHFQRLTFLFENFEQFVFFVFIFIQEFSIGILFLRFLEYFGTFHIIIWILYKSQIEWSDLALKLFEQIIRLVDFGSLEDFELDFNFVENINFLQINKLFILHHEIQLPLHLVLFQVNHNLSSQSTNISLLLRI